MSKFTSSAASAGKSFIIIPFTLACLLSIVGCGAKGASAQAGRTAAAAVPSSAAASAGTSAEAEHYPARTAAELPPLVVPKWPDKIPGYTEVDPATGLHMTGQPVHIDVTTWRLKIGGAVRKPASLSYDDIRMLAGIRQRVTIVCEGYFEDTAVWNGASIEALMALVEPKPGAKSLDIQGADGYSSEIDLATARASGFLAYGLGDGPVPVLHGFPLRAIFPTQQGAKDVKWITGITVQ